MHGEFLSEIVWVVTVALVGGVVLSTLKQPPILGYIVAGILLGPSGMELIKSRDHVALLAELGVLLLLFVVGMELNLRNFKKIWGVSTFCTLLNILFSFAMMMIFGHFFEWSFSLSLLLSFVVSVSSTAVVVKILESRNEYATEIGQTIIGVLIAQDLAIVPMIILIKSTGSGSFDGLALGLKLIFSIGLIVALIAYLSRRQRISIPLFSRISEEKDLIPLVSLMVCFGASAAAGFIGLSEAYGAFLAGLLLGNSHEQNEILHAVKPIQSILLMTFCLSIGLLLDVEFVFQHWKTILTLLSIITFMKTAINIGALSILRVPWGQAFFISASLAQVGEFAFLLVGIAKNIRIVSAFGEKLIIALTVLSLLTSPLWMMLTRYLDPKDLSQNLYRLLSIRTFIKRITKSSKT